MKKIFDTHAHYDDEAFDEDRDEVLRSLKAADVERVVNVSASLAETQATLRLVEQYDFVYGTAGVHPDDTKELTEENFETIRQAAMHDKILAIGEIGLDYHWMASTEECQKYWFSRQMELAKELHMPIMIHSRDAHQDTLDMIRAAGGKDLTADIHCFSGSVELAKQYLDMGHYLGIGGVVTYKNGKKMKQVVKYMPLDRILLETDAPYLSPSPFRGKRNSSDKIRYVVEEIAALKEVSVEEVLEVTWNNALQYYGMTEESNGKSWQSAGNDRDPAEI